ncbi:MAG: lipopolysaccharide biosynthesis protein [Candidatus Nitrosopumilus sp. bin_7KS]
MSNIKKKIFDISSIGITDGVGAGIAAFFWFYIASELGPENYGELTFLISIAALVSGITLFGSNNTILVLTAKKIDIQATIYLITIIANVIGSIIIFVLFFNLGISLVIVAYAMFSLVTYDLLGRKLYQNYSKYIIIQKILLVGFGVGLYYIIGENGILIGIGLSHIHFIYHIVKTFKNSKINFGLIREKRNFILNNFAISISGTFYGSLDKLIIAPLLGFAILGNYSLGLQFFSILNLLPAMSVKYLTAQDASGIANKKLKKIMVLISVGIAILGSTIAPMVISSVFPKFIESEDVIRIISWAVIPSTIQATFYFPRFWAQEKNRLILFTSIIVVISQIIGILVLGPTYGAIGIALSFFISNVLGLAFTSAISKFYLKSD